MHQKEINILFPKVILMSTILLTEKLVKNLTMITEIVRKVLLLLIMCSYWNYKNGKFILILIYSFHYFVKNMTLIAYYSQRQMYMLNAEVMS